jgi:hypothetical protein
MDSKTLEMTGFFVKLATITPSGRNMKLLVFLIFVGLGIIAATTVNCVAADKGVTAGDRIKVCRLNNPPPRGYLAVDYVADPVQCPNPSGYHTIYTAMIIEKYEDKPVGARMEICSGQKTPKGWVEIGPSHGIACPREPGDTTQGPTRWIIERLK